MLPRHDKSQYSEYVHDKTQMFDDPNKMQEMIKKANGLRTVPQIFIDGQHIGGNDKLQSLERKGKLNSLLGI